MLYQLNLILNSNHGLALFRQNQILWPIVHRNLQKWNNEDLFIQLLNTWLHFTNNDFATPTSIEEILGQPLFLNPHTKLDFSSNNPYFIKFLLIIFQINLTQLETFVNSYNLALFPLGLSKKN